MLFPSYLGLNSINMIYFIIFQIHVSSPVVDGRAVLHLKTVRFPSNATCTTACTLFNVSRTYGLNLLGVNEYLDMERTFQCTASKSSSLLTHMQRDRIDIDLGYITSAGKDRIASRGQGPGRKSRDTLPLTPMGRTAGNISTACEQRAQQGIDRTRAQRRLDKLYGHFYQSFYLLYKI